jgi:DNA-binding NarL/FixJ family response regulator
MRATRILIADDNPAVRYAVRQLLEPNPGCEVCGEAQDGGAAVEMVAQLKPDIVILDFKMPGMNGLEAAYLIANFAPKTLILLFTGSDWQALVDQVRDLRTAVVIFKQDGGYQRLKSCIDDLLKGNEIKRCRDLSFAPRKRQAQKAPSFPAGKSPQHRSRPS